MVWLTGYSYQKLGAVNATTAGAQTLYQLKLVVGESSGASGEDVDCENHCLNFPYDIRFTKEDGITKHDYWIDTSSLTGTTPNRKVNVWIKVASIPVSGSINFYMYYGKTSDTGESNGDNTFIFFDDFSAPLSPSKWSTKEGEISVSNGNLILAGTTGTRGVIEHNTAYLSAFQYVRIGSRWKATAARATDACPLTIRKPDDDGEQITLYGGAADDKLVFRTYTGGGFTSTDLNSSNIQTYHIWDLLWKAGEARLYQDYTLKAFHDTRVHAADSVILFREGTVTNENIEVDWVYVGKYASPEPTWGDWAAEKEEGEEDFYEDFTTFTEVDVAADRIQKTLYHIAHYAERYETTYLYKDYGVDHFTDFTHKIKIKASAVQNFATGITWAVANDLGNRKTLEDGNKTYLSVYLYKSIPNFEVCLRETHNGSSYEDVNTAFSVGDWIYIKVVKSGTALNAYLYSDATYSTLVDTLTLTLHANHTFKYLYGCNTYNTGDGAYIINDIENFNLGSTPKTGSDSGTGTDTITECSSSFSESDTGSGTDQVSIQKLKIVLDSVDSSENVSRDAHYYVNDSGTTSSAIQITTEVVGTDNGQFVEVLELTGEVKFTDSASGQTEIPNIGFSVLDTGQGNETITLSTTCLAIDVGQITEVLELTGEVKVTDSALGQTEIPNIGFSVLDTGGSVETTTLSTTCLIADNASSQSTIPNIEFSVSDLCDSVEASVLEVMLTLADQILSESTIDITASVQIPETGTSDETITSSISVQIPETGTSDETITSSITCLAIDTGQTDETITLSVDCPVIDVGQGNDISGTLSTVFPVIDTGQGNDIPGTTQGVFKGITETGSFSSTLDILITERGKWWTTKQKILVSDLNRIERGVNSTNMLAPYQSDPPDMKVHVSEGYVYFDEQVYHFTNAVSPIFVVPETNPRWDGLYLDSIGSLKIIQGEEAGSPQKPQFMSSWIPIAYIYHRTSEVLLIDRYDDDGTNGLITDIRKFLSAVDMQKNVYDPDNDGIVDNTDSLGNIISSDHLLVDGSKKLTGHLDFNGHRAIGLIDPSLEQEVATKTYVDTKLFELEKSDKIAGEPMVFGNIAYLKSDDKWHKASALNYGTAAGHLAIVLSASVGTDESVSVLVFGIRTNTSWSFTRGAILYLGATAGTITETKPSETGQLRRKIGFAYDTDTVYFNPDSTVQEVP